jgi:hypothetical protein
VVEYSARGQISRWLHGQPHEVAKVFITRAALRAIPSLDLDDKAGALRILRATSIAWVASAWPNLNFEYSTRAAARKAASAARRPGHVGAAAGRAADAVARTVNPGYANAPTTGYSADDVSYGIARTAHATDASSETIWSAISSDVRILTSDGRRKLVPAELVFMPLWQEGVPAWAADSWRTLRAAWLQAGEDWEVWTEWYEARLEGRVAIERLEAARVLDIGERTWGAGPKVANAQIKAIIARFEDRKPQLEPKPPATRTELAEVVSPAPSLTADNRLDAGPNPTYDAPTVDVDLPTLPIRQRVLVRSILEGLPQQAPAHLRVTLQSYDDELLARGAQPILGLLKDMASIVSADVGDTNARREWLAAGLVQAFDNFFANHELFVEHFPLDTTRDELYARTPIDELAATGPALSKPFDEVREAVADASQAGLTTDDFVKIVSSLAEFAKTTSSLPIPQQPEAKSAHPPIPTVTSEDQIAEVSPKKRTVLTGIGFFERVYNLAGSTASIFSTPQGIALLDILTRAIQSLSKLLATG